MLELSIGPRSVILGTEQLRVKADSIGTEKVKSILKSWYIQQAEDCLLRRTQHFASRLGVKPSRVLLRQYRSQWGRCNSRQEIAFDWRVVMAPDPVIDYLVIHELCHIKHFNHSSDFWAWLALCQTIGVKRLVKSQFLLDKTNFRECLGSSHLIFVFGGLAQGNV